MNLERPQGGFSGVNCDATYNNTTVVSRLDRIGENSEHWNHPAVGVTFFGPKVSARLSSLSEEPAVRMKKLLVHSF